MGEHQIQTSSRAEELRTFAQSLLEDLRALERLLEEGYIERDVRRIGAEQEVFLVDSEWQALGCADDVLPRLAREGNYTSELARFNLEANMSPQVFVGDCLSRMHAELDEHLDRAEAAAAGCNAKVLLCGILPTLHQSDLTLENMSGSQRYHEMNRIMRELRGGEFLTFIKGHDELQVTHDNVMMEACNTSFQVHFQVDHDEFPQLYNLSQLVTAPVLAAGCNSPVLLQHRLWHETRVALFQQSLDVRSQAKTRRGVPQRVSFGERWVDKSVVELFREDVARFRILIAGGASENPMAELDAGRAPALNALRLHNGTVYRWNRPCYGVGADGRAHLRIEQRVLPSGPTTTDEMANAAFYFGLMTVLGDRIGKVSEVMEFEDAKANFFAAARYGLDAQFRWIGGRTVAARDLILLDLLPLARRGLKERGLDASEVDRYLDVLEERVRSGRTGSQWAYDSLAGMRGKGALDERHRALTVAISENQRSSLPVHCWPLAEAPGRGNFRSSWSTVARVMTRDVFTVHPEDVIDLAANLMDWEHIRRIPVEDDEGLLVGLLSQRGLMRLVARGGKTDRPVAVSEVMRTDPVTVTPETSTIVAIRTMREHRVGCLPVVSEDKLVGIVTEHDFIEIAAELLEQELGREE